MVSVLSTLQWLLWPILFCFLRQHLVDGGWTATYCRRQCTLMAPIMGRLWIIPQIKDLTLLGITGESGYLKSAWSPAFFLVTWFTWLNMPTEWLESGFRNMIMIKWSFWVACFSMWSIWWRLHSNHTDAAGNNCDSTKVPILKIEILERKGSYGQSCKGRGNMHAYWLNWTSQHIHSAVHGTGWNLTKACQASFFSVWT